MRKFLFCTTPSFRSVFLFTAVFFLLNNSATAQCGLNAFAEPAGALNPTNSWQSASVGSATYADFNVITGNIYSFRYTSGLSNLNNLWDMTFSSTSAVIPYNNSLTPVRDSWTGGEGCANTTLPGSLEWYATTVGTVRINTNSYNGGCLGWVNGQTSALLEYKVCPVSAEPAPGSGVWNVAAFATTDISIPVPQACYGYYVDNSGTSFATTNYWGNLSNPSTAVGWTGCSDIPNDNVTIRARRVGFPCNRYIVTFNGGDDKVQVYINGALVYNITTPSAVPVQLADMILSVNDLVEIRQTGLCNSDYVSVSIVPQGLPVLAGGTIGGIVDGSSVCEGQPIGLFTNVADATGGTFGFVNGGSPNYSWTLSTDGGITYNVVAGVTTSSWNSPITVPPGATYVIYRLATDACFNTQSSNSISVVGSPSPNGSLSPATQTVCPGTVAVLTVNFSPGTGPYSFSFTDGATTYSRTGKNDGDTIQVVANVTTNYNFVTITDSYGCSRNSGFTGGAQVITIPPINISYTLTDALCNGGSTGTITVTATGGQSPYTYSIDNGVTYQALGQFTGLPAGSYDIVVQDNFGCIKAYGNPAIVGQPTDIVQVLDSVDASCANVFDGSITVTASGGTPGYNYSLNGGPPQPGNVFTGVGAGSYNIYVYDNNGCVDTGAISVGNTYVISVSITSQTDVSCSGAFDGTASFQVNGGVPPYMYSINGISFQSSPSFTGLSAGTYIVTGRDSKGCTEFVTLTINQPAPITVVLDSLNNITCGGSLTGDIYITATGGNGGNIYTWTSNGTVVSSNEDLVDVVAGNYTVSITDVNGCSATAGFTITEPYPLYLNIATYNNVQCFGDTSGSIDVTANGGVPAYSYLWSNTKTTEDIYNLLDGTYTVTVTDANGCTATISQTITSPQAISSTITAVDVNCNGDNNGSADLTVTQGTAPYTFLWSNFLTSEDVSGLHGGLYYVQITDANGCISSNSVLIGEPSPLNFDSVVIKDISCYNLNDGAIHVYVSGGTPGYVYNWSDGSHADSLASLQNGIYAVTVIDAHNCTITTSITVINPEVLTVDFFPQNPLCNGDTNGSIHLLPTGGTPNYSYLWSASANNATSKDVSGLTAGSYSVSVTDSKGCTVEGSVTLTEPDLFAVSGIVKDITCHNDNDGTILTSAYGGTPPYTYHWVDSLTLNEPTNGPFANNLAAGVYWLTTTDAHGCRAVQKFPITNPVALTTTHTSTNVLCYGACTGQLVVTPHGGTGSATGYYSYLWNNFLTDSALTNVCAGHYVIQVTDSNGCFVYDSIEITQPSEISIAATITDVLCKGASTGAIDLTVIGGVAGYTYSWTNTATTEDISGLAEGPYGVTVTDANSCPMSASYTVKSIISLFYNVSLYTPTCHHSNNGFVAVDITGGSIPYSYAWSTSPPQNGAIATNLTAGNYILTATDANACSISVSVTLADADSIIVTASSNQSKCYNTATGWVTASATGGVSPYVYMVNGIIQPNDTFRGLMPGLYTLGVRDVNGCEGTTLFTIVSPDPVTVDLEAPQFVILEGMSTQLFAHGSAGVTHYYWSPLVDSATGNIFDFSDCADSTNCSNPLVAPRLTTVFTVFAMNDDSCEATDTVTIYVLHQQSMYIPSAFTPNGDGLNDRFEFDILGATHVDITIFSRWGDVVYHNDSQANGVDCVCGWDGKKGGKDLPYDTYVYKMKITLFDEQQKEIAGTVTIMK